MIGHILFSSKTGYINFCFFSIMEKAIAKKYSMDHLLIITVFILTDKKLGVSKSLHLMCLRLGLF